MHIELVDVLRCPRPHEDSWLVVAIHEIEHREVVQGTLGCPVCSTEYPIRDRVVEMTPSAPPIAGVGDADADVDAVERLAAMLDLAEPRPLVILGGAWSRAAVALHHLTEQRLLLVGSFDRSCVGVGVYGLHAPPGTLPIAGAASSGIALDVTDAVLLAAAAAALRPGGRLVVPSGAALPGGVIELVRDARWIVGERRTAPSLVSLGRG